ESGAVFINVRISNLMSKWRTLMIKSLHQYTTALQEEQDKVNKSPIHNLFEIYYFSHNDLYLKK
ncbi:hypothetical protein D0Y65_023570, partial [Glycine soja]